MFRHFVQCSRKTSILSTGIIGSFAVVSDRRAFCAGSSSSTSLEQKDTLTKPVLYQYAICPFCNKVKAYLDFLKLDYVAVEVNPLTKSEIAFSKQYKKVPIAVMGDVEIQDSSAIIQHISDNLLQHSPTAVAKAQFIPSDTAAWDEWSEKKLAVMLYPNITRSMTESWECFGYAYHVSTWNPVEQYLVRSIGAVAMSFANGKIKKKYGIVDERKELFATLDVWCDAVGDKPFLHGKHVSLPDLMVYGVLRSIQGLSTFTDIMREKQELQEWYKRVAKVVDEKKRET